eukprot:6872066-Ditylum_brightwellii.AAC.1
MFFYNLELDEESQGLCTIVTPLAVIKEVLAGLNVEVYINNIGISSTDYDEHLELVRKVLQQLQENSLK